MRSVVIQPRTALGKFAFAAVLVGAGVLFLTVGLALALSLAAVAVVTGVAVVGYRAITGSREAPARAAARWRRAPRSVQGDLPAQAGTIARSSYCALNSTASSRRFTYSARAFRIVASTSAFSAGEL